MILPRGDQYNVAVQNPKIAFTDTDLKSSSVETDPLGLPKPYSGGFTITYKLSNLQNGWAVRCFHRDIQDLQKRYQAIGNFFSKHPSRYFVDAKYLPDGIRVDGKGYPVIKMLWLEGSTLDNYLEKIYNQKAKVEKLMTDFVNLISEMEKLGIAHGDLQHGNIIVKNENLYMIDYDGMFIPELASLNSNEIGHINYQHPKRSSAHYNQNIDRFSAIVIYIGLKAISLNSKLWKKYGYSDNILLKSKDFANLQQSPLIQDLSAIQEIRPLVEKLIGCCHLEFDKIPSLNDFLLGNFSYNKSSVGTITINRNQYEILDASKSSSILEHFGEKVEVVGRIAAIKSARTKYRDPFIFLNFGASWPYHTFTIVIWEEGIAALQSHGISPSSLVGKWVSVTGVIASYGNKPQTVVELPTQIQILTSALEANQRLRITPVQTINPPNQTTKKVNDKEADVFNELYKHKPIHTLQKVKITQPAPSTSQAQNSKKSSNSGCSWIFILAGIGALIGSAYKDNTDASMWYAGAMVGGAIGLVIYWLYDKMN